MNEADEQTRTAATSVRPILGGLLIGGGSKRMGRPKSRLMFDDATFGERIVDVMKKHVTEIHLLGDGPIPRGLADLPRFPDPPNVGGPLAGILAALRARRGVGWIIVGCDQPLITDDALTWLLNQRKPDRLAIMPRMDAERIEPLLAIYETGILEQAEKLAAQGISRIRKIALAEGVFMPTPPVELRACWTNVNTPEDYALLKPRA